MIHFTPRTRSQKSAKDVDLYDKGYNVASVQKFFAAGMFLLAYPSFLDVLRWPFSFYNCHSSAGTFSASDGYHTVFSIALKIKFIQTRSFKQDLT